MENNQKTNLLLIKDLGMQFATEKSKRKVRYGLFKCFCNKEFKAQISTIKNEHTKSCGCLKENNIFRKHRLFGTWYMMIHRCNNPKNKAYSNYGERGIKVCDRWLDVKNFIEDMYSTFQDSMTLDRKNNNKGYNKDNCRWVTRQVQTQNTRLLRNTNKSGYRGVSWNKQKSKWISVVYNIKRIYLGSFSNAIDGALAYDKYIIENNLEHTLNFKKEL